MIPELALVPDGFAQYLMESVVIAAKEYVDATADDQDNDRTYEAWHKLQNAVNAIYVKKEP